VPQRASNRIDRSFQTDARAKLAHPEVGIASDALADSRIGEVFLSADELGARVEELGAQIAADYTGRELLLIALLKASFVFLADLSRAIPISHQLDFVELAGYNGADTGGHSRVRLLKDTAIPVTGLDVLIVEDVVDTGLTLNYLRKLFDLRKPATLRVAALLDRPYRRLVDDLPVDYVGFTVPDEFFVGYGFDVDGRWRNLPDLRLAKV
jgi:hypoxanthine phosphoribosyltransferase